MVAEAEIVEIKTYFQNRLAESKRTWSARGKDARIAVHAARAAQPPSWRQLSGVPLFMHELGHVGNKPFAIGFGVTTLLALWIQTKFTDEMKENSAYWSQYHLKDGKKGGH